VKKEEKGEVAHHVPTTMTIISGLWAVLVS
jgi:hypothetical protein